jgi:hypothetical protein
VRGHPRCCGVAGMPHDPANLINREAARAWAVAGSAHMMA